MRLLQKECKKTPASAATSEKKKAEKGKKLLYMNEKPDDPNISIDETPGTSGEISSGTEAPTQMPVPIVMDKLNEGDSR